MIKIDDQYLTIVKNIIKKHVPECEVKAFGSRVNGTPKIYSDLDLAIKNSKKIPIEKIIALKDDFDDSIIPFRIDIIDWNAISNEFKNIIDKNCETIQ